jgi:predicted metal-dependent phosphoesterase TrpH
VTIGSPDAAAAQRRVDLHLHSTVSDGELAPSEVLARAARAGITHLAIADHDSVGAYTAGGGQVFAESARLGLSLIVGIELDADWEGCEVHLLGYEIDPEAPTLSDHLRLVRDARHERARRDIEIVNQLLGEGTVVPSTIFVDGRETLMKPHFIHPLLDQGRFATYEEANAWYREHVRSGVSVPRLPLADAIRRVHEAGGWTVLAHPGYYELDGRRPIERIEELAAMGLDGVEVDYPYHTCSPHRFSPEAEADLRLRLERRARALGLRMTRGSDCHTETDFQRVYGLRDSARLPVDHEASR